jgi:hypothetical protein
MDERDRRIAQLEEELAGAKRQAEAFDSALTIANRELKDTIGRWLRVREALRRLLRHIPAGVAGQTRTQRDLDLAYARLLARGDMEGGETQ